MPLDMTQYLKSKEELRQIVKLNSVPEVVNMLSAILSERATEIEDRQKQVGISGWEPIYLEQARHYLGLKRNSEELSQLLGRLDINGDKI